MEPINNNNQQSISGGQQSTAQTDSSTLPVLAVETKFNQGYRVATAVNAGGEVVSVCNSQGQVELFTQGSDGNIWNFYPDTTSDTGYSGVSTGLQGSTMGTGVDANGNIVLFAATGTQLNYIIEQGSGNTRWSSPTIVNVPLPNHPIAISAIICQQIGSQLYVGVLTKFNAASQAYALAYSTWNSASPSFQSAGFTVGSTNCIWLGNSNQNAAFVSVNTYVTAYSIASGSTTQYPMSATFSSVGVATTLNSQGSNQLFAILSDGNVNMLSGGASGQPYYWMPLSMGMNFRQVQATTDLSGNIDIFGISADNQLYHWTTQSSSQTGYSNPPAAIQQGVALLSVTADDQGEVDLFTVATTQAALTHLYQEELTSNWAVQALEVPKAGVLEQYVSYSTDITVYDSMGALMPNAPVNLWSAEETKIYINGMTYFCNPNKHVMVSTNQAGVLSISQEAGSLAIPGLQINITNAMPAGQSVVVQQDAGVQDRLATLAGTDLMDAKDQEGNYIIGDQYRTQTTTDSMASAFNQCMKVTQSNNQLFQTKYGYRKGVWLNNGGHPSALLKAVPLKEEQHWHLQMINGELIYKSLTREEAQKIIADKKATYQSAFGFFDWLDDIGDFVEGIVEDVIEVVDYVVTTVGDAIEAAITFVVDGVTYIFDQVVNFVEEALDVVESIFAAVKVFFEKVWEWIGFLFSWSDILRTHEAVAYTINQMIGFAQGSVTGMQAIVDNGFNTLSANIASVFQDAIQNIVGTSSVGGYTSANTPQSENFGPSTSNNTVFNNVVNNSGGATSLTFVKAIADDDPLNALLTTLQNFGQSTESNAAFDQAISYFNNMGSTPDQIFTQGLAALLSLAEGVVLAVIAGVKSVVDAIFQLAAALIQVLQDSLNESWDIPIVSELYEWLTGSELTTLDLISLIIAIPITFTYKIIYNSSPFPDSGSVTTFTNSFSSQTMLQSAGLGGSSTKFGESEVKLEEVSQFTEFLAVGNAVCTFFYGCATAINDAIPKPPDFLSKVAWVLELGMQGLSFPWFTSSGAPSCDYTDPDGCAKTVWIYQNVGLLMDATFIKLEGKLPENANDAGVGIQFVYAIIHLTLAIQASEQSTSLAAANNIMPVIPEMCKPLRLTGVISATKGISLPVLAVIDGGCYLASAIIGFENTVNSSSDVKKLIIN